MGRVHFDLGSSLARYHRLAAFRDFVSAWSPIKYADHPIRLCSIH